MKKIIFISAVFFSSCYVSKKLDSPAVIRIKNNFEVTLEACNEPRYISYGSKETYRGEFLDALENELKENNLISQDTGRVDYVLEITELKVKEDISVATVNDDVSRDRKSVV